MLPYPPAYNQPELLAMPEPRRRPESLPSRRNLPRASHACERCRVKKAKCDQRQPCSNCVKHFQECIYGLPRQSGRNRDSAAPGLDPREADRTQLRFPTLPTTRDGGDPPLLPRKTSEPSRGSDRSGMPDRLSPFLPPFFYLRMNPAGTY